MSGVTTPAVTRTREPLEELGYGMLVLATSTGGRRRGSALLVVEQKLYPRLRSPSAST